MLLLGCWLVFLKDQRQWNDFIGKHYYNNEMIIARLEEPLVNKPKSYKAEASIQLLDSFNNIKTVKGNIIIYLQKDSLLPQLHYGSTILFKKPLQPIKNAGNPGGFDYERHSAFKGLYYQVFLRSDEYIISPVARVSKLQRTIYNTRDYMLQVFKKYIPGNTESGLAEALLAGYKDDLDKGLVEQYANTGVVHIIAISGLHLGLIYLVLILLLSPLKKRKSGKLISAVIVIVALWFFSLLTGAAPSITRSAIMFTIIVAGNFASKKSNTYNSLCAAAFLILAVNPFNLWNVGFQLSFAALLSIATFANPITATLSFTNKWLQKIWQLIAVTLAAQIFTLPIVLYHFHQFPVYFLLANMLAVPLSTIILWILLLLLFFSKISVIASLIGWALHYLIFWMNSYIGWVAQLPSASIGNISITITQVVLLFIFIAAISNWLMYKTANALLIAMTAACVLTGLYWLQYFPSTKQQQLIVYNVPQHAAIDIIKGRHYHFIGDSAMQQPGFLQNFHLLPARIKMHAVNGSNLLPDNDSFAVIDLHGKRLVIIDKLPDWYHSDTLRTDYLLISTHKRFNPYQLLQHIRCSTIILDGRVTAASVLQWKNAADSLHLRLHSVQEQGAFVLNF